MELKAILESILFAAEKPINPRQLRELFSAAAEQSDDETAHAYRKVREEDLNTALEELEKDYAQANRSNRRNESATTKIA